MKIVLAGASGLIGRALGAALRARGDDVRRLVRRPAVEADEIFWRPETEEVELEKLEGADALGNLAGENIAGGRWTAARREQILRSRVAATRTLVRAATRLQRKPGVLINASATGIYGEAGDTELTEASPPGPGFLAETCLIWETNAEGAARAGIRTVLLRFGIVLAAEGGALAKLLPLFRLGLGGRVGAGTQWMSWIARDDAVGAILHALDHTECAGAINVVAPEAVTNAEFSATLGRVLHRPAILPVPAWGLRLVFGQMAVETMLASTRVRPARLLAAGFGFRHPDLPAALRAALER
jgi:uncharacterized protein (TIGR01777 family)